MKENKANKNTVFNLIKSIYMFPKEKPLPSAVRKQIERKLFATQKISTTEWDTLPLHVQEEFVYIEMRDYLLEKVDTFTKKKVRLEIDEKYREIFNLTAPLTKETKVLSKIWINRFNDGATEQGQKKNYAEFVTDFKEAKEIGYLPNFAKYPTYDSWVKNHLRLYDYRQNYDQEITEKHLQNKNYDAEEEYSTSRYSYLADEREVCMIAIKVLAKTIGINIDFEGIKQTQRILRQANRDNTFWEMMNVSDINQPISMEEQNEITERKKLIQIHRNKLDNLVFILDETTK